MFVPRPEYLFAMKCRAMRLGGADENADIDDIRKLILAIGLVDQAEALALVGSFYPAAQLQPKVRFGIEEMFSRLADGRDGGRFRG